MSSRKYSNLPKKPLIPTKESLLPQELSSELLRLSLSRSEDTGILKSLSDKKTSKFRLQSVLAERSIEDCEHREEWRVSKEDNLLLELLSVRIDETFQKHHLEKLSRKMLRISLQYEEEIPTQEQKKPEIQLYKSMNTRMLTDIFEEKTVFTSPIISTAYWRENFSKEMKIAEYSLYGENITPYNTMCHCVETSRKIYQAELKRQKTLFIYSNIPSISVSISYRPVRTSIPSSKKSGLSPLKKAPFLPEIDWETGMSRYMLESNISIEKSIKKYSEYFKGLPKRPKSREQNYELKTKRARNFEKYAPVNPLSEVSLQMSTVGSLNDIKCTAEIILDIDNNYFEENQNIYTRIKMTHSCILIEKEWRKFIRKKYSEPVIIIQKIIRKVLSEEKVTYAKARKPREMYLVERLKHWYPVLVFRYRCAKMKRIERNYEHCLDKIKTIERYVRGYLYRKMLSRQLKKPVSRKRLYEDKKTFWKISELEETVVIKNTLRQLTFNTDEKEELEFRMEVIYKGRMHRIEVIEEEFFIRK